MDELKLLIEMVAGMPTMALWVLIGYLVYKLAVIGSIYGTIRFGIEKLHSWLVTPKRVEYNIAGRAINADVAAALMQQVGRLGSRGSYIYSADVEKLRKAIDEMEKAK